MKKLLSLFLIIFFQMSLVFALAKIDLNTATPDQLNALPGVGDKVASEIIAHRPFKSVDELKEVKGIGDSKFEKLKDLVSVGGAGESTMTTNTNIDRKGKPMRMTQPGMAMGDTVNLNTASQEELERLPGIGMIKAKAIIAARPFASAEDVMKVKGIKQGTYNKIKDHIVVK